MKSWFYLFVAVACVSGSLARAQIASLPASFQLRTLDGMTIPYQNGIPSPAYERQLRPTLDLAGSWRKERFAANGAYSLGLRDSAGVASLLSEAAGRYLVNYDDSSWPSKDLPGVENTLKGFNVKPEVYEDGVWYRRTFTVPESLQIRTAVLKFLAVNYVADVWLNGMYLGYHEGGYTPFSFDASSAIRYDTVNVLAVRVDNPSWGSRNDIVPYGTTSHKPDWFNYTGIIHDIYLEFPKTISVSRVDVIPQGIEGDILVTGVLWNTTAAPADVRLIYDVFKASVDSTNISSDVCADLIGAKVVTQEVPSIAVPADSASALSLSFAVPSPRLWSPKYPNLYILRASAVIGTDTLDQIYTQFGIRKVGTQGNALLLNGKPMFFPGLARHEDHYLYGRSVPKSIIFSDMKIAVGMNATFIRTAHYPNHPYTYLIADRLGIAVLEEIPVWWFDETDAWIKQDLFRHIHEQMWREMIFRDRNRPSILFWSTCNECIDQTNRQAFIQRLNAELDAQYPDGRLVTESAAADRPGPSDPTQSVCDVAGWTMYFGIFHGSTYYGGTKWFLQVAQLSFPTKPILDTEFGYWSTENQSSAGVQVTVFDSTFRAFNEFVAVDSFGVYHPQRSLVTTTWWALFDWFTVQTGNQTMGLYQMDHVTMKPVAARMRDTYLPFKEHSETAVLGVEEAAQEIPRYLTVQQNYPNPFNPTTTITWSLPREHHVRIAVYDVLGREVALLVDATQEAGTHSVRWDASRMSSGMYILRASAMGGGENRSQMKAMILLK